MATFYIDPTAGSGGDGSFESPFNSWTSVTWTAGNTYLQKENTTYVGSILPTTTGTSSAYITVGVYDASSGTRLQKKTKTTVNANGGDYCFFVDSNTSYFIVQGLVLTNAILAGVKKETTTNSSSAAAYIKVYDCTITKIINSTADLGHGCLLYGKGNEVRRCFINTISTDGIISFGDDLTVTDCFISNINYGDVTNSGDCLSTYDGNNCYIARNYFDNVNQTNKQVIIVRNIASGSVNGIIEDNVCVMRDYPSSAGNSGKCLMVEQGNVVVRRNQCIGGEFGIWLQQTNILCYSNLVISNSTVLDAGIAIRANSVSVYNNTLIGIKTGADGFGYGISHNSTYTSVVIKNNVIVNYLRAIRTASSGADENYNWLYNNTQPVVNSANTNKSAGANTTIGTDPLINNIGVPRPASPLKNVGLFLLNSLDLDRKFRNNPPTIGAYECVVDRGTR